MKTLPDGRAGGTALSPARPASDALWDDWELLPRVPAVPMLHLDGFDGPIDLLLELAERQRLDLGRLSVVALVDQFVTASAELSAQVPIERRAHWLVMAARLVLLRSRLLFPASPEASAQAEREAEREVERLEELRVIRSAASWLQARPQLGVDVFARGRMGPDPRVASYMALMEACLTVLRGRDERLGAEAVYRPTIADLFRIREALRRMRAVVAEMTQPLRLEAFLPGILAESQRESVIVKSAVASTLVAALELCRSSLVALDQQEPFGPITVSSCMASTPEAS